MSVKPRLDKNPQVQQEPVAQESVNVEELLGANQEFADENARLQAELKAVRAQLAKNRPAIRSGAIDAEDFQVGQDGIAKFEGDTLITPEFRTMDDPRMIRKMEIEKFMAEPVTVQISDVSEDQADIGFVIEVNGDKEFFRRGETKTVKRKFIEGLARAKKTAFKNQQSTNANGEPEFIYPSKTGLRYPFSIMNDANPRGAQWLQSVLRQP
jgi:hypothetical protein